MTQTGSLPKKPGLRDVARLAGVSTGTVSNVLNRPESVTERNRERVLWAIEELGFVGSRTAIYFRKGRTDLIGFVVPDVGNPFWADVLRGVETVLDEWSIEVIVASSRQDQRREGRAFRSMLSRGVDGILIAPVGDEKELVRLGQRSGTPMVLIDRRPTVLEVPAVVGDDVAGGRAVARHLLELGHRKLLFVNGPDSVSWSADRLHGVREEVTKVIEASCDVIAIPELTASHGYQAAMQRANVFSEVTGVLCGNDLVALGVLRALRELDIAVPDAVSVAGYDDVDFAAELSPALTTMRQPSRQMGEATAALLNLARDPKEPSVTVYEPELIRRRSTGPAR